MAVGHHHRPVLAASGDHLVRRCGEDEPIASDPKGSWNIDRYRLLLRKASARFIVEYAVGTDAAQFQTLGAGFENAMGSRNLPVRISKRPVGRRVPPDVERAFAQQSRIDGLDEVGFVEEPQHIHARYPQAACRGATSVAAKAAGSCG